MNSRVLLYTLIARHGLDRQAAARLAQLAGLDAPPAGVAATVVRGTAVLGAALGGFGLIVWLAANWPQWGRLAQFALLQVGLVVAALVAWQWPRWRVPSGLLAFLTIGGVLAFFGQTYQTGADPWQHFAWWTLFTLPLCLSIRGDVMWLPWVAVTMTALSLWLDSSLDLSAWLAVSDRTLKPMAWGLSAVVCIALQPGFERWTGTGRWSWRLAVVMSLALTGWGAMGELFGQQPSALYLLALLLLAGSLPLLLTTKNIDVLVLTAVVLTLDVLVVTGLGWLLYRYEAGLLRSLLLMTVFPVAVLAFSVRWVLSVHRRQQGAQTGDEA